MKNIFTLILILTLSLSMFAMEKIGSGFYQNGYRDFELKDNYMYSIGENNLIISDMSIVEEKQTIREYPLTDPKYLEIFNDYLLVGFVEEVCVYNISNPENVFLTTTINIESSDIIVADNKIFITNYNEDTYENFVSVIDDFENFGVSFTFDLAGHFAVQDNVIYNLFRDGNSSIAKIYEIQDSAITFISESSFTENFYENDYAIKINNDRLYLHSNDSKIISFNIVQTPDFNNYNHIEFVPESSATNSDFVFYNDTIITASGSVILEDDNGNLVFSENITNYDENSGEITTHVNEIKINNDKLYFKTKTTMIIPGYECLKIYDLADLDNIEQIVNYTIDYSYWSFIGANGSHLYFYSMNQLVSVEIDDTEILNYKTFYLTDSTYCHYQNDKFFFKTDEGFKIYSLNINEELIYLADLTMSNQDHIHFEENKIFILSFTDTSINIQTYDYDLNQLSDSDLERENYYYSRINEDKMLIVYRNENEESENDDIIELFDISEMANIETISQYQDEDIYNISIDNNYVYTLSLDRDFERRSLYDPNELVLLFESSEDDYLTRFTIYNDRYFIYRNGSLSVYNSELNIIDSRDSSGGRFFIIDDLMYDYYNYQLNIYRLNEGVPNDENITLDFMNEIKNLRNYPNPFSTSTNSRNPQTTISFEINENQYLESANLNIFNVKGQKVKSLFSNKNLSSGNHSFSWNGEDESGKKQSSGVYFYQLRNNNEVISTNKMMIID